MIPVALLGTAAFAFAVSADATSSSIPQTLYGGFSNGLPTSSSFFPIGVYYQSPSGGDVPAPYTNQAQAFKAEGIDAIIGISPGWPTSYGVDSSGELQAACNAGLYVIGSDLVGTAASGAANSVQSVLAAANSEPSCAKYLVGYELGDEPACSVNVAAQVAAVHAADPTRMAYENTAGFYPNSPGAQCVANLNAPDIASADDYPVTNPWSPNCLTPPGPSDCIWQYGVETQNVVASAQPGKPVWLFVETGSDNMAFGSQNGSVCNASTNLCSKGNELRATPVQVNSSAWLTLINGSQGLEWFCDDSVTGPDACAGGGAGGQVSRCSPTCGEPANLTYIDHTVEGFAPELNTANVGGVTVSSSNSSVPIDEMTKQVNGTTYLFVESDRDGSTTGTYTDASLAGATATLVYDSAGQYDPANSEQGKTFTLSDAGSFSDSLGTAANPYQVKVYTIDGSGSTTTTVDPPPTTTPPAPTTTQPAPTTTDPPPTTTQPAPTTTDPPPTTTQPAPTTTDPPPTTTQPAPTTTDPPPTTTDPPPTTTDPPPTTIDPPPTTTDPPPTTTDPPPTTTDPPPTTTDPPPTPVWHHHHHHHLIVLDAWWWWRE